ncbi:MAG: hypothetical protein DU429_02040 [Candidatus Tokpelaia sp.]|nr:MAG: hypothetical protein DU430_03755 [Candidatus Tokpelaia sp.]KAA6207284.1 MAG: hypothetical protein DU429_02040 [Candidatus Tokpelaia sp.]KAA6405195.1 hypothetical protein DPQ22_06600 [Candidatus Tokpelaia sp.]
MIFLKNLSQACGLSRAGQPDRAVCSGAPQIISSAGRVGGLRPANNKGAIYRFMRYYPRHYKPCGGKRL